jgi:uncharacterized protein (DUF302 family)
VIHRQVSTKSISAIDTRLRESAARHKFGIIAVHDLQQTLKSKGVDLAHPCLVYEVCNPLQAKKVLDSDGALSAALPCRISVHEGPEGTVLATILPTAMMGMFNVPGLYKVAQEVEDVILAIMREAV